MLRSVDAFEWNYFLNRKPQTLRLEFEYLHPPEKAFELLLTLDTLQGLIQQLQDALHDLESYR